MFIATINSTVNHYGSTVEEPVNSTFQNNTPTFVAIEGIPIASQEDLVDTPSHIYAYDGLGNPLFHSHENQTININNQSFVTIENNIVLLKDDKHNEEDTRIDNAGQSFVIIN